MHEKRACQSSATSAQSSMAIGQGRSLALIPSISRNAVSADSELRLDTERGQVLWSDTNGATYADDYALVTLGATQVGLMQLEPGANALQYSDAGSPNLTLEWSFYAPYH